MSRIKTKRTRYTADDDTYILGCVERLGVSRGAHKAAVILGRTHNGIVQRYYNILRGKKRMTVTGPATIEVNPPTPVKPTETGDVTDVKSVKFSVKGVEVYMVFK